ncbi:hypothetical protein GVN16_01445 [Emticicia sp. CRIBPO]|uniref:hypothetical protein n=1 Tax=Emticicia sp. CRIBPO TaxID=2683258 RepID=UPI0014128098|nr:hypothetical protein [Emticicia sp. CRIBPO]NBA84403.1 hypothetical protein [Emticicia sp. CRIBPO]
MKKVFLSIILMGALIGFSNAHTVKKAVNQSATLQKQTFGVVSFTAPKGWQQQQNDGGVQLSVNDKKSGGYAIAVITKAMASAASVNENFHNDWNRLVKVNVQVNGEPVIEPPVKENNWDVVSGTANYTEGGSQGVTTLLTATGGGQTVSVLVMTNTKQYQNELMAFLNSLELVKASENEAVNTTKPKGSPGKGTVVGLWSDNHLETSGYSNGFPQYTAGYFRREYLFKDDGTYVFRLKNWSVYLKEILFAYESGTYVVQGNQLTIIPKQGRGEWWSKKDNNTKLWGNRLKASDYKLEKTGYTFEIKYYSGSNDYALILNPKKNTERDGTYSNQNGFSYIWRSTGESVIDNAPGF